MAKALISIDYTEDFVADHGKLTAGAPAQAISDDIYGVTQKAFERGDYIFFTIDAHEEKLMLFILKVSCSRLIILLGLVDETCMAS